MTNLVQILAFGVEGNLSIARDQDFAHAALKFYGQFLARGYVPPVAVPEPVKKPKQRLSADTPSAMTSMPTGAASHAETSSPGKRDLYKMLQQAVANTSSPKDNKR